MRGAALLLCIGCSDPRPTPAPGWTHAELDAPRVLIDGLDDPRGLVSTPTGFIIAERGAGRVISVADGEITVLADRLVEPTWLALTDSGVIFTDPGAGQVLHITDELKLLADGLAAPSRIIVHENTAWWVDSEPGEVWTVDLDGGGGQFFAGLDTPEALSWTTDGLLIASAGACDCIVSVDPVTAEQNTLAWLEDNPMDILATEHGRYVTGEAHRWPYGGWIYSLDPTTPLSQTAPRPRRIAANSTDLFWTTNEALLSVPHDGGTYTPIAILTAPADLVVTDDAVTWTDRHRGALLQRTLE